jgi:hypothetical protein
LVLASDYGFAFTRRTRFLAAVFRAVALFALVTRLVALFAFAALLVTFLAPVLDVRFALFLTATLFGVTVVGVAAVGISVPVVAGVAAIGVVAACTSVDADAEAIGRTKPSPREPATRYPVIFFIGIFHFSIK